MKVLIVLSVLLGFCTPVPGQSEQDLIIKEKIDRYIKTTMQDFEIPGMAIGIIREGRIFMSGAYGVKDIIDRAPITEKCLFHMSSISEPFVATAIMQLVEANKIELDSPITTYLPYFKMKDPRFRQITVRQLLTHTSGMPDIKDFHWEYPEYDDGALTRYVLSLAQQELLFNPGEKWKYSRMAYDVLGHLIAKVSLLTFEEYMDKYVLTPLDMTQSTFFKGKANKILCTSPHIMLLQPVVNEIYPYTRAHAPSSTLHASIEEMCHFALANLNGGRFEDNRILKSISFNTMWTPFCDAREGKKMGLSWFVCEREGDLVINNSGGDAGFRTNFCLIPKKMAAIILLSNYELTPAQAISMSVWDLINGKEAERLKIPVMIPMGRQLMNGPVDIAIEQFERLKETRPAAYNFSEEQLNSLGYQLLRLVRIEDAIEIFKLNVASFPDAYDTYDSLGEAYLMAGRIEQAQEMYEKSLTLNPENKHALQMIKKIQSEVRVDL